MSGKRSLLIALHNNLSPSEFEKLIYTLLDKMGFSGLELTGMSGDGGIDLTATWTQSQVPGLEIDLNFVIQVKRLNPKTTLNPMILRALRGSMNSGQWGLLVTTGRVSAKTREEGLRDLSRIISVVDGSQLVELCVEYEVGVKHEYHFDASFLKPKREVEEPPEPSPPVTYPRNLSEILTTAIGEPFEKVGRTPMYRSSTKTVIARWSQKYKRKGQDYWYALTPRDIDSSGKYNITYFAYVCSDDGVVLLPGKKVLRKIGAETLLRSPKEGPLRHYHIIFYDDKGELKWVLRNGVRENVEGFYYRIPK